MTDRPLAPRLAHPHRRFFVPEVIQTSSMDCGPATLKAVLEGFRVPVSYGRLREACHTDVDGTSIDTLEEIAQDLNMQAEQIMIPLDHVLLPEAHAFPAIAVTRTAAGHAHFVVLWRQHGPWIQVMDPARGRLWLHRRALLRQLFVHSLPVQSTAWREWAVSEAFLGPLRRRALTLGLTRDATEQRVRSATADSSWRGLARLDASLRLANELRLAGAVSRASADATLDALMVSEDEQRSVIHDRYWSVRVTQPSPDGESQLLLRGAVFVRISGPRTVSATSPRAVPGEHAQPLPTRSPELIAALREPPAQPIRHVLAALRADGHVVTSIVGIAILVASLGVVFEAVLLRSVLDLSTFLGLPEQRLTAAAVLAAFATILLGVEVVLAWAERRAGSHLEARLRIAFLDKIPRLADSYFQSRPISDMLERSHGVHILRALPQLGVRFLRVAAELSVTTLAIAWLAPQLAGLAILACAAAVGIPLLGNSLIAERDLKVRTHAGALARFHLDALLGRTAIDAHRAESTIAREHDRLLSEWARASLSLQRGSVLIEGVQMLVGFALAGYVLFGHFASGPNAATLLLTYWVLNLPALGYELALTAREYPAQRNTILRLLEPLGAPDAEAAPIRAIERDASVVGTGLIGVDIDAKRVSVRVSGQPILENIDLHISPGTHVAIVGTSGAGKSTLVGLLLGWHRPASGDLLIDGAPLTADHLAALRRETAWVDPSVQLWNRSLLDNLLYGSETTAQSIAPVIEAAALLPVIAKLPEGLATPLGEGGALLSAGEGQRVRFGRAFTREHARLVILDEPFLGLERDRRRALLAQARQRWSGRTLLYVTHDVSETRAFDRVLVLDHGRIVEDGEPLVLAQMASSRYRRLLQAQEAVHGRLTTGAEWRRIRLESGRIVPEHGNTYQVGHGRDRA